ncbi:N-acetyltransferase family protein [Promicromonospora sp. CA-289599]|uniref:GNAT family N-acetyltransferase n=1 Tax=Promicromonospora sp. CA-289599 TaxID=3240014 RepID=UPI003D8AD659
MRLAAGGPNDVDACVELWRTATAARDGIEPADVPETVLARARGKLESAAPSWVLAREPGGTPVGFGLTLSPGSGYADDPPDAAYVALLAVAPRAQGHGVGGALLDAMTELSAAGMSSAVLHVLETNTAARCLYDSRGWTVSGSPFPHALSGLSVLRYTTTFGPGLSP